MFKKYKLHLNLLPLIILAILSATIILNIKAIFSDVFINIFHILVPFIWAASIAYLLNPIMMFIERKFKLKRGLSLILTYLIAITFILICILVIVPSILDSILDLFKNLSNYATSAEHWIISMATDINSEALSNQIQNSATDVISKLSSVLSSILGEFLSHTIRITSSLVKFIFGCIISIYMLIEKEKLISGFKKIVTALSPSKRKANSFLEFIAEANSIFGRFIIGKTIDSIIIGVLCYVGLVIFKAPYAALISLIVGITNMIPYFGPFIGMIPAFILVLFVKPSMALWVLLYIFMLQQFDGWYLGPKILGDKVGVSPLAIILAVTLGGGLGGVIGMFLSVPIIALIKIYGSKYLEYRISLNNKNSDEL